MLNRKDLDKIVVTPAQLQELMKWRDQNKDAVRNYKNVLEEGLISSGNDLISIYFKAEGDSVEYKYYFEDILVVHTLTRRVESGYVIEKLGTEEDYSVNEGKVKRLGITLEQFVMDNTTIHCTLMAYITFRSSEVEIREEDFLSPKRLKKSLRHNKYNPSNTIKVKKKVVYLKNPTFKNVTKREYVHVTQSWGVRGHPRRLKSGKITWIPPYTKGEGKKKTKKYEL